MNKYFIISILCLSCQFPEPKTQYCVNDNDCLEGQTCMMTSGYHYAICRGNATHLHDFSD